MRPYIAYDHTSLDAMGGATTATVRTAPIAAATSRASSRGVRDSATTRTAQPAVATAISRTAIGECRGATVTSTLLTPATTRSTANRNRRRPRRSAGTPGVASSPVPSSSSTPSTGSTGPRLPHLPQARVPQARVPQARVPRAGSAGAAGTLPPVAATVPPVPDVSALAEAAARDVEDGLPACQLAVARDGEVLWSATFGDADPTTRFCIFSATKPIVASAIWLLIGDGLLDVDAKVADYVPEFATNGKEVVTVEQVLLHTAGFPTAPMRPEEGADPESRRRRFGQWRLQWDPGSRFEYHALSAHWVLADLIERLAGLDFRDFVEQRVTAPLGLPRVLGLGPDDQTGIAPMTPVGATQRTRWRPTGRWSTPTSRSA